MAHTAPTGPRRAPFRETPNAAEALALDKRLFGDLRQPAAFGLFFDAPEPLAFDPSAVDDTGIATLRVCGPLEHHRGWWTSYDDIAAQAEAALLFAGTQALVLRFDSPGGVVSGTGECAKALVRMRQEFGKPIYAFVDEMAASAAYWLASACDEIWLPEAGQVGSIGVILCVVDETKRLAEEGVAVRYLTTGARKADLQPGAPLTDEVLKAAQAKVDYLGGLFFGAVAQRRGMTPAAVQALDAAVFHGGEAVRVGLADGVAGWPNFLGTIRGTIGANVGGTRGTLPGLARPPSKDPTTMKLLQAQAARDAARTQVDQARAAYDAAPTPENLAAYMAALNAQTVANTTLAQAQGKVTVTRQIEHKERVVEREDDPPAAEDPEDEEDDEEDDEPALRKPAYEDSSGDESAIAALYKAGKSAASNLAQYAPSALVGACEKALGVKGIRAVFGALHQLPERLQNADALQARVAKLESSTRDAAVKAIVTKAKREGRTTGAEHRAKLMAFGRKHGVDELRGVIAMLPQLARSVEDGALQGAQDGEGAPTALPNPDKQEAAMLDAMFAGMAPEAKAKAIAEYRKNVAANTNHARPAAR